MLQGGEKYQQSFYVYEELAQGSSTFSVPSLIAQAVCEIHLGRLEEAQSALEQAIQKDPKNAEGIANLLVLNSISGNSTDELVEYVFTIAVINFAANRFQITEEGESQPSTATRFGREEQSVRQGCGQVFCQGLIIDGYNLCSE